MNWVQIESGVLIKSDATLVEHLKLIVVTNQNNIQGLNYQMSELRLTYGVSIPVRQQIMVGIRGRQITLHSPPFRSSGDVYKYGCGVEIKKKNSLISSSLCDLTCMYDHYLPLIIDYQKKYRQKVPYQKVHKTTGEHSYDGNCSTRCKFDTGVNLIPGFCKQQYVLS